MSDEDTIATDQFLSEPGGNLQIVEVTDPGTEEGNVDEQPEYTYLSNATDVTRQSNLVQVIDEKGNSLQLDLTNFTLVQCDNNERVQNAESAEDVDAVETVADDSNVQMACVLNSDGKETEEAPAGSSSGYVAVLEGENGPQVVFVNDNIKSAANDALFSSTAQTSVAGQFASNSVVSVLTNNKGQGGILDTLVCGVCGITINGRHAFNQHLRQSHSYGKNKAPAESSIKKPVIINHRKRTRTEPVRDYKKLLASPSLRLYLYSCKHCDFRCNGVRELAEHKSEAHPSLLRRAKSEKFLCARCPHKTNTSSQLMRHIQQEHFEEMIRPRYDIMPKPSDIVVPTGEQQENSVDVFVCGACGYESEDKSLFCMHLYRAHSS